MPKTASGYTPDRGEVTIALLTADITIFGAPFVTEEDITLDGVVRKLDETQPRTREYSEVYVTAEISPIKTMSSKQTSSQWTLIVVDDYSKGLAGEWGTDTLTAVEIFEAFFNNGRVISEITSTPAGNASPAIETTLTNVDVLSITHPKTDADANAPNEVTIQLVVESMAKAAHA